MDLLRPTCENHTRCGMHVDHVRDLVLPLIRRSRPRATATPTPIRSHPVSRCFGVSINQSFRWLLGRKPARLWHSPPFSQLMQYRTTEPRSTDAYIICSDPCQPVPRWTPASLRPPSAPRRHCHTTGIEASLFYESNNRASS